MKYSIEKQLAFVDETIEYFTHNPLGKGTGGGCVYFDEKTGNKCALGRCLLDPASAIQGGVTKLSEHYENLGTSLEEQLRPEYRGLGGAMFWIEVQNLHDHHFYASLTEEGKKVNTCNQDEVDSLKNSIKRGGFANG